MNVAIRITRVMVLVIFGVTLLICCAGQPESNAGGVTITEADRIARVYADARNTPDLSLLDQIYATDVVVHDPTSPEPIMGLAALKAYYQQTHDGIPDFKITFDETFVRDSLTAWVWTMTGTQTRELRGIPPTGQQIKATGVAIDKIVDGKIVEEWVYFNPMEIMGPLGFSLTPPSGEQPGK